ncbi:hypothetical protein FOZ63_026692 [Perkinsus olseni]|uniref:WLM domain-containing protein n=2 Tax=Perkinsus olseni TaxID=32597 RepID=A0A7J6NJT8_PEROL|nr:hypothetical protein FOZ63_026692 [Perkinsus olseni]
MQNVRKPYDDEWHNVWKVSTLGLRDDDKAQRMLNSAAQLVIPIMKKRRWRVAHMMEFVPKNNRLLGLNVNRGLAVKIRLRRNKDPGHFLSYMDVLGTVLHELVHNSYGPHNATFYKCLDSIKAECEVLILGHPLSLDLINRRPHRPAAGATDGTSAATATDTLVEFSPGVGRKQPTKRTARKPRIKRARGRKLGGDKKAYAELPQRELARMAAERRMRDAQLCDTHDDGPDDSPPISSPGSDSGPDRGKKRRRSEGSTTTAVRERPEALAESTAMRSSTSVGGSSSTAPSERRIIELSDSSGDDDDEVEDGGRKCPWCTLPLPSGSWRVCPACQGPNPDEIDPG